MNISFSSTQINYVKDFLSNDSYNWLNKEQKEYIMLNLGDIRVQDPSMYKNPRIEIHNNQTFHNTKIMDLTKTLEGKK